MNKPSEEKTEDTRSLSRRGFVRIVRDTAVVLILPQALGCSRTTTHERELASANDERKDAPYQLKFLSNEEATTLDAVTGRIIPTDERPGAREARVVHFIDFMLMTSYLTQQASYRDGLKQLNRLCQRRFRRQFAELTETDQDKVLTQMDRSEIAEWREASDFFATIRGHTIEGMFSDPKYHGNAGRSGWGLMGL